MQQIAIFKQILPLNIRILLLIYIIGTSLLFSQNDSKVDSLKRVVQDQSDDIEKVKAYAALYNTLLYQDHTLAKSYAESELKLAKKIGYKEGVGTGLYHLGVYYNNIDNSDSSEIYYQKALNIFEELGNKSLEANVIHGLAILEYSKGNYKEALNLLEKNVTIYSNEFDAHSDLAVTHVLKGGIYRSQGNYKLALNEALNALKLYETLDEPVRKADALGSLAAIEFNLENFDQAIAYNREALEIYEVHNDQLYAAQALNDIGDTYFYLEKYDEALDFLYRSLSLSKVVDSKDLMATSLGNIGKVYTKQGKHDEAITKLREALELTEQSGNQFKNSETLNDLGIAYNNLKDPKNAIAYFDKSIAIANKIEAKENLRTSYINKTKSYEQLGNYQQALATHKAFTSISDSIFNNTKQQQIEELRTIYETEKKEQQIFIQDNEIALLEQKAKVDNLYKILFAIGFLFFLFAFYAVRQKLKQSKLERETLDMELEFKKKELTTRALHLAKKNEVLEGLKQQAKAFKASEQNPKGYNQLIRTINFDLKDDNNWEHFSNYFESVHKDFYSNAKKEFPKVTPNELRLMALLKMNLSSKEIANILNISQEGVKKARYRLRKKLNTNTEESLQDLVLKL